VRGILQQLFDVTFVRRRSCDRRGPMPGRLKIHRAYVAQRAGGVWANFAAWRELVADSYPAGCSAIDPPVQTEVPFMSQLLQGPEDDRQQLADARINQCYLFHGTSLDDAVSIAERGFDLDLVGSHQAAAAGRKKGRMFGSGVYFGECSSKADEYASDGSGRRGRCRKGAVLTILLCRVVLGQVLRVRRAVGSSGADPQLAAMLHARSCDSLLGDMEGSYREFIVPSTEQVFLRMPKWPWTLKLAIVLGAHVRTTDRPRQGPTFAPVCVYLSWTASGIGRRSSLSLSSLTSGSTAQKADPGAPPRHHDR